jgi:hypothetical protein
MLFLLVSRFNLSKSFNYMPYLFTRSALNRRSLMSEYGPSMKGNVEKERKR